MCYHNFMATIDEFKQIEMKIGTIISAEKVENADKLLRLMVDFNEDAPRQILSGIAEFYVPEELVGKQCPFVTNLEPRTIRGLESNGMILAVGIEGRAVLLHPDRLVDSGSGLR